MPYALPEARTPTLRAEAMSVAELAADNDLAATAELQWRLSVPLSTLILALLAVPLSKTQPRQGRYGKLAIGVLVFIIYYNLLGAAKVWIERGQLAPELGTWLVHGAMLAIALGLLALQNGLFERLRPSHWRSA